MLSDEPELALPLFAGEPVLLPGVVLFPLMLSEPAADVPPDACASAGTAVDATNSAALPKATAASNIIFRFINTPLTKFI
jgi:hypothetical protein